MAKQAKKPTRIEWQSVKTLPRKFQRVDVWLDVWASPLSMGMSDRWRVMEAWRENGKWFHRHEGKNVELENEYITHWIRIPDAPKRPK